MNNNYLLDDSLVGAGVLVHLDDGVEPPVGDEDLLAEDDEGEGVPDEPGADGLDVGAVQAGVLDVVEQRVAPVQPVLLVVHGESVGPAEDHVAEGHDVAAVAVRAADVGRPVPLGEEHVALVRVHHDRAGSLQVLYSRD